MKKILLLPFILFISITLFAQIPDGYYDTAIGQKERSLKTALHLIIKDANVLSYGSGAGKTWSGFAKTDVRSDGTIWDMYSNNRVKANGNSAASGMNIEHSLAKSWWGRTKNQAYKDLFHLNPSNIDANSRRSSYPLAIVHDVKWTNGVIKVGKSNSRPGGQIDAWEPADQYKGDLARAYMYMVTAYEDFADIWKGNSVNQLDNNTYPVFEEWAIELLLDWCEQDPVSEKEINRNNEIYKIQGNRNPYIDYPLMAEYVWGKLKDVPFTPEGNVDFPYLSTPTNKSTLDFGLVAYQKTKNVTLRIKGVNLEGNLSISITGANAPFFSTENFVLKEDAENGYDLTVEFSADDVGEKTAELNISGGGISGTTIMLKALSSDDFMALPATYVSSTGFTANWTISANATGYLVDVYSMQNDGKVESVIILEEDFNNGLPSGWGKSGFTEHAESSSIKLASGSQTGSITTPTVDLSGRKATLTVKAKQYRDDTNAELTVSLNNQSLTAWETDDEYEEYGIDIAGSNSISIKLSATKGNRIFVDYVKVETQGSVDTPVSVNNFPKSVGNVLSLEVNGLEKDSTYYYVVTPLGNNVSVSNEIAVYTQNEPVDIEDNAEDLIDWFVSSGVLHIHNLPDNYSMQILDLTGKQLYLTNSNTSEKKIKLPQQGIYLLRIIHDNSSKAYKILY